MTNTNDDGPGSLREAIEKINASPPSADGFQITFDCTCIPDARIGRTPVIKLLNPLPNISFDTSIDGSNGFYGEQSIFCQIVLDGSLLGEGPNNYCLEYKEDLPTHHSNYLQHLTVSNAPGEAVIVSNHERRTEFVRFTIAGCTFLNNQVGIYLDHSEGVDIGSIHEDPNQQQDPNIPTDLTRPAGLANGGNLISGNSFTQIEIVGGGDNLIQGNFIGTNAAGTAAAPGSAFGLYIADSSRNIVGGLKAGQGNLISGNNGGLGSPDGAFIFSTTGTTGENLFVGNYVGVNLAGTAAIPNRTGVAVVNSPNNIFQYNLVSGNIGTGITIQGKPSFGNRVLGNRIGTDVTGAAKLGNGNTSIDVLIAPGTIIGGTTPGFGNIVADTKAGAAAIQINTGDNTKIQGNFIGTDPTGLLDFKNSGPGIQIYASSNMTVGGIAPGAGNLIANNGSTGIRLVSFATNDALNNAFRGNSIFRNLSFAGGIDLGGDGPTANDLKDPDNGPNHLQNYPVITLAKTAAGRTEITGTLNSTPSTQFDIEFFASPTADRQGKFYIGRAQVNTDAAGNGSFILPSAAANTGGVPSGYSITATALGGNDPNDPNAGETSEFSDSVTVTGPAAAADVVLTSIVGSGKSFSFRAETSGTPSVTEAITTSTSSPGATLTYTFALKNLSASASGPLTFSDPLPVGLTFVSVTSSAGTTSHSGNTVTASFSSLAGNASATVTITATIDPNVAFGTYLTNRASLSTDQPDPNPLNNQTALSVLVDPPPGSLANISTRLPVGTGDNVLIAGFIVQGSAPKKVIIVAAGPSLTQFGVPNALANPQLELHDASSTIGTNDDWQTTQIGGVITSDQAAAIQSSGLAPSNAAESAIIATLSPGRYSAIVRGADSTTGVGIAAVYDLSQDNGATLANISTRGFVDTGDGVMIGGIIVGGGVGANGRVVVRAIGPSLTAFGVPGALQDPTLELDNANGTAVSTNDDWQLSPDADEIRNRNLGPGDPHESAVAASVTTGNYTAIVRGKGGTTGVALVEVYNVN